LIQTQQRSSLLIGYLIGAALMGVAAGVQAVFGGGRRSARRWNRWPGRCHRLGIEGDDYPQPCISATATLVV
jgi:hypothetical protein